jgi:peptidoglycan/xylan/chitin deacetylase (PgdA/CDA1 family)
MHRRSILISRKECQLPFGNCLFTFDDGPAGRATEELLYVLHEFGVKACFCVVGSQVVARPEQIRALASGGHLLVNHTYHHYFRDLWRLKQLQKDLSLCDEAVASATGGAIRSLPWFRPPFGLITTSVRTIARERRILPVTYFAFDPWFNSARNAQVPRWIIQNAKRHGGGIYVLHDGLVGSPVSSFLRGTPYRGWIPRAVRQILESLSSIGFQFPEPSQALASLPDVASL